MLRRLPGIVVGKPRELVHSEKPFSQRCVVSCDAGSTEDFSRRDAGPLGSTLKAAGLLLFICSIAIFGPIGTFNTINTLRLTTTLPPWRATLHWGADKGEIKQEFFGFYYKNMIQVLPGRLKRRYKSTEPGTGTGLWPQRPTYAAFSTQRLCLSGLTGCQFSMGKLGTFLCTEIMLMSACAWAKPTFWTFKLAFSYHAILAWFHLEQGWAIL